MRVWSRRAVGPVFLAAMLALGVRPVVAKAPSQKVQAQRHKLRQTVQERRAVESKLREVKRRQRRAYDSFRASEQRLAQAERELRTARAKLGATERRLRQTKADLERVNTRLEEQTEALWKRLEVFYKKGSVGYAEVVLGATSFEDFVDRATFFRSITKHDLELKSQIEEARAQQVALKNDLEQTWRECNNLRAQYDEKAHQIRVEANRKRLALASVKRDRKAQEQIYLEIRQAEREIERTLYRLTNPPGSAGGSVRRLAGGFIKPASGRYTSRFGWRRHPIHGRRSFHDGIDIANSSGTTIRAAAGGTVVQAGWHSRAYGYAVMIKHGSGYVTLYGHCSSVLVHAGQKVSQGQAIARMGSTGYSTGSHVHFSVYKNGRAINPLSVH